jgi:hypothetical protein
VLENVGAGTEARKYWKVEEHVVSEGSC